MNPQRANIPLSLRFGKWAGFFSGSMGWGLEQQILSTLVYTSCPPGVSSVAAAVTIVCAAIALGGGLLSLHALRALPGAPARSDVRAQVDRFIAICSIMMAVLGVFAIAMGTSAGWILRCER